VPHSNPQRKRGKIVAHIAANPKGTVPHSNPQRKRGRTVTTPSLTLRVT
jgi:hypothetical protein